MVVERERKMMINPLLDTSDSPPNTSLALVSKVPEKHHHDVPKKVRPMPYDSIAEDPDVQEAIRIALPQRYHFEIPKTIWKLRKVHARHVGLQMPDGLLLWAPQILQILKRFGRSEEMVKANEPLRVTIMGDVNFGACCIDDFGAKAIGVDFLVHYGHSCLIPIDQTVCKALYIFVRIDIDIDHLVETIKMNFGGSERHRLEPLALMGTVQFNSGVCQGQQRLVEEGFVNVEVKQSKPLSQGEVLGCTAPSLSSDCPRCIFVCDGRFHLESLMMQNPSCEFFRYDPYTQVLTTESLDRPKLEQLRFQQICEARKSKLVGLILGTLGRQGSVGVLEGVKKLFDENQVEHFVILISEITKEKLNLFRTVDAWVQIACPRLSLDWGHLCDKPLLSSYEAYQMFSQTGLPTLGPMDYYANKAGPWGNYGISYGGSVQNQFGNLSLKAKRIIDYEK